MAPSLPCADGARPSLERGGLSSTHRRGEVRLRGSCRCVGTQRTRRDLFAVGRGAGCTPALNRLSPLCFGRA